MISIIGATHPGQREYNEDCYAADTAAGLAIVADGMGGYACGEVASDIVKQTLEQASAKGGDLAAAIAEAHDAVIDAASADKTKAGMGSTAVAAKFDGLNYQVAWVGDSRAYLWDGESELKQITRDHSYVESLLSTGAISYEEAINHPNRNLITQAVGVAAEGGLQVGELQGRLAAGQQLILCSDGLVDEVLDHDIAKLLAESADPEEALNTLIRAAVVAGGHDNITVVIVTADGAINSSDAAIEPQIVRLTSLGSAADQATPTQPRPSPAADITRMGGQPFLVDDDDEDGEGWWQGFKDFIELNLVALLGATALIALLVLVLLYFS